MNDVKEYDFVVYGATGFTGKLVVEYALSKYLGEQVVMHWNKVYKLNMQPIASSFLAH